MLSIGTFTLDFLDHGLIAGGLKWIPKDNHLKSTVSLEMSSISQFISNDGSDGLR